MQVPAFEIFKRVLTKPARLNGSSGATPLLNCRANTDAIGASAPVKFCGGYDLGTVHLVETQRARGGIKLGVMVTPMSREQLVEAALQLEGAQLGLLVRELLARRLEAPALSRREDELFAIINAPDDAAKRAELEALTDLAHTRILGGDEEERLLELVNWSEINWTKRLEAVMELARIRGRTTKEMLRELGLARDPDEVLVR